MVEKRYGVLRLIAVVLKVIAWLVLIAGVTFTVMVAVGLTRGGLSHGMDGGMHRMGGPFAAWGVEPPALFVGLLALPYFIMFYAFAEGILVVLGIEENTRLTAERLAGHAAVAAPAPPPV